MPRPRKLPPGMALRGKVYYACFRKDGRLIRRRLSSDFEAARVMLNDLRARADMADFDLLDNNLRIEELKKLYLRHCEQTLRPGTFRRYRDNLEVITQALGVDKVSQITVDRIMTYRADRLAGSIHSPTKKGRRDVSPVTVNMDVAALSRMLNWAVTPAKLIGSNPLGGTKPLPTDEQRKVRRPLSAEEIAAIFEHSPEYLRPVWRTYATTGLRRDELVDLTFDDVDFDRGVATVRQGSSKTHEAREVPLDDLVLAEIRELKEKARHRKPVAGSTPRMTALLKRRFSKDHVFVTTANTPLDSNLLQKFHRICRKAGIADGRPGGAVDIHSLRVTFTTLAIEHGASPKAVQAMLGHSTLDMTMKVYAKATERAKRTAVNALPFASCTTPDHIVSLSDVRTARASSNAPSEVQAETDVA